MSIVEAHIVPLPDGDLKIETSEATVEVSPDRSSSHHDRSMPHDVQAETESRSESNTNDQALNIKTELEAVDNDQDGTADKDAKDAKDAGDKTTENEVEEEYLESPERCIPEVRICNWEEFKNRFTVKEGQYAIEALIGGALLSQQMNEEEKKRRGEVKGSIMASMNTGVGPINRGAQQNFDDGHQHTVHGTSGNGAWIHRVRINSKHVMKLLGSFTEADETWDGKPHTFLRPFRYFIYFHDQMKTEFEKMQKIISEKSLQDTTAADMGSAAQQHTTELPIQTTDQDEESKSSPDGIEALRSSPDALEDVQCYIDFVEREILPAYQRFDSPNPGITQKVRFQDLAYLFRVDDFIYVSNIAKKEYGGRLSTHQTIRKIYCVQIRTHTGRTAIGCDCSSCRELNVSCIHCYYLDFDGERYGCIKTKQVFEPFEGEKEITQLPFYPVRFMKDFAQAMEVFKKDGANYVGHVSRRYGFYSGWTMVKSPLNDDLEDAKGDPIKSPEHVESDVLVDFAEAFNSNPNWKPQLETRSSQQYDVLDTDDKIPVQYWTDIRRTNKLDTRTELIVDDDGVSELETNKILESNQFLVKRETPVPPSGDDLALLPRRMFAYAVWDRKFVHIDSRYLKRTTRKGEENEAFEKLQIDQKNKTLIEALLQSHFKKKDLEFQGIEVGTQDLIRGKGRGVVILLHGVPGVGKTATAEAVAQKWQKPLFPITCGDLGFTPEKVEETLKDIFRLAHLWDCVLLLDEADVFIAQREKNDLQRNALVSVFLRMLEYYNGVLFLTTNRVGVLDEAIKSRVHLHLYYNSLNKEQTREIFKHNIERLKEIEKHRKEEDRLFIVEDDILTFAHDHHRRHSTGEGLGTWNGRQIRNAFLIAASLAHHGGDLQRKKTPAMQKQLTKTQFELVDETTMLYDQFRYATLGGSDSFVAGQREERNDGFITHSVRRTSVQVPLAPGRQSHQQPAFRDYQDSSQPPYYGSNNAPMGRQRQSVSQPQELYKSPSPHSSYHAPMSDQRYQSSQQQIRDPPMSDPRYQPSPQPIADLSMNDQRYKTAHQPVHDSIASASYGNNGGSPYGNQVGSNPDGIPSNESVWLPQNDSQWRQH